MILTTTLLRVRGDRNGSDASAVSEQVFHIVNSSKTTANASGLFLPTMPRRGGGFVGGRLTVYPDRRAPRHDDHVQPSRSSVFVPGLWPRHIHHIRLPARAPIKSRPRHSPSPHRSGARLPLSFSRTITALIFSLIAVIKVSATNNCSSR